MPKISIVIPAYNAMNFLPETMANVLKQTYQDFEVILVNDGSSDNIKDWVCSLNQPKVKLISQENGGASWARNTGIKNATGEYIAFLDADDLWEPTKLEKQMQVMDQYPETGLVYVWTAVMNEKGELTGRYFDRTEEGDVWRVLLEFNLIGCGSVPLIQRNCFDEVGLFDLELDSFAEDWDLWLRMAQKYTFRVVKTPLVYYRQRVGSGSKNWEGMERGYQLVIDKVFRNVSPELNPLQKKCQAFVYLNLAWIALQGAMPEYQAASQYQRKAIENYFGVILKLEFWRLSVAIFFSRFLGGSGYQKIRSIFNILRTPIGLRRS